MVATAHGTAITGAPGSATVVSAAIDLEVQWSAENLGSMENAIRSHEADASMALTAIDPLNAPHKIQSASNTVHSAFTGRPPFNPGFLTFTPAVIGPELGETAASLLGKFNATNDAAVGDAITFWSGYASRMSALAGELLTTAGRLTAENSGIAIDAAAASLTGLAGRVTQVATSAGIMAGHLGVLPAVRAMAISQLGAIELEAETITDPAAREAYERSAIANFLGGPYISQLQSAVPDIPNLTQPDMRMGVPQLVQAGVNGGHGIAGASQAGLAPTGMTSAASAPASAAPIATSGPITSPNGMNPASSPMGPSSPMAPATGTTPTIPGSAPVGTGTTAPSSFTPASAMPAGTTGMNPAGAGGVGAGHSTSAGSPRGLNGGLPGAFGGGAGRAGSFGGGAGGAGRGPVAGAGTGAGRPSPGTSNGAGHRGASAAAVGRTPASASNQTGRTTGAAAHAHGPYRRGDKTPEAGIGGIRGTANDYEQDEYQRELFGDEPVTVPALIGRNVRG